jgi:hypothetical protein
MTMSALVKLGTAIRNAWRHYRWPWHEPGGIADEWDPITGKEVKYPRPEPWHLPWRHQHKHGHNDTDRQPG